MFAESSVAELAEASKHKPGQRIAQQKVASTSSATGKTAVHSKKKRRRNPPALSLLYSLELLLCVEEILSLVSLNEEFSEDVSSGLR